MLQALHACKHYSCIRHSALTTDRRNAFTQSRDQLQQRGDVIHNSAMPPRSKDSTHGVQPSTWTSGAAKGSVTSVSSACCAQYLTAAASLPALGVQAPPRWERHAPVGWQRVRVQCQAWLPGSVGGWPAWRLPAGGRQMRSADRAAHVPRLPKLSRLQSQAHCKGMKPACLPLLAPPLPYGHSGLTSPMTGVNITRPTFA